MNIHSETLKRLELLQEKARYATIDDYINEFEVSDIINHVDLQQHNQRRAMDILYKGTTRMVLIEMKANTPEPAAPQQPPDNSSTMSIFDMDTLRDYNPKCKPKLLNDYPKQPFRVLIQQQINKSKYKNTHAILDDVFIDDYAFSNLKAGRRKVTLEILSLFALALKLTPEEAYEFIFSCEDVSMNTDTMDITYAALMYSLETKDYDTVTFTECCFDCFRAQNNEKLPYSIRNWHRDYENYCDLGYYEDD